MSTTLVDALVILVLVSSTLFAWSRGLVRETLAILGWVIALFVAARFAYLVVPYIEGLPFIRDYVADSCELLTVFGFVILFLILMVVMAIVTPFFSDFVKNSRLGIVNSAAGGIFGFARGVLIVLLVFLVYDNFVRPSSPFEGIDNASTYRMFNSPKENISEALPDEQSAPNWLSKQFSDVTKNCTGTAPNV